MLVAIDPPAERALRVVQVERDDPVDAQVGVELGERSRVPGGRAEVVARGEGVLGVEADAQPLAPARLGAQPPELLEAPADLRSLSGRVLERDGGGEAAAGLQHLAERARRRAEARVLARAAVRARMRDQVRDAEALAALELGDQLAHRARAQRCDRRRRVGQVGVVREQRPDAGRRARRREGAHVLLGERAQRPLPRRAREELDRLAAERPPALEGAMEPARDRLMRAEERAGAKRRRTRGTGGHAAPWLQAPVPELKLAWGRGRDTREPERRDAASKPRINRLALERQHPEDALVDPIERLLLDEAVERLEAEGELAKGERALGAQASLAQALEVLGERVLGTVDDAKVLAPAALESGLDQPPPRAHEEVERLDDHPLRTAPGDRLPPARTGLLARRVGHIHDV